MNISSTELIGKYVLYKEVLAMGKSRVAQGWVDSVSNSGLVRIQRDSKEGGEWTARMTQVVEILPYKERPARPLGNK